MFSGRDITSPNCRGLVFPDGDIAHPNSQHGFRRIGTVGFRPFSRIPHRQCGVVLAAPVLFFAVVPFVISRQRHVIFLSGAVYDGRKGQAFKGHRAVELIMSSPYPSTHKRIRPGVRKFDSAVWDREKQNAVLSGNYAKFTLKLAMKNHL